MARDSLPGVAKARAKLRRSGEIAHGRGGGHAKIDVESGTVGTSSDEESAEKSGVTPAGWRETMEIRWPVELIKAGIPFGERR